LALSDLDGNAEMLTAVAYRVSLFTGYMIGAGDGIDSPLEALHTNGQACLEFSDRYRGTSRSCSAPC
jgi:hypothetical protein